MSKELHPIYYNSILRGIAFSLFGIFVPIYLLTHDYSLNEVLLYFLIHHTTTFIFTPVNMTLSRKVGYKPLIISSVIFVIMFILMLKYLEPLMIPVYLVALVVGLNDAFYFTPLHGYFTRLTQTGERGTRLSHLISVGQFAGLVGPIVGGVIATYLGFSLLFLFSLIFVVLSIIPLFTLKNIKPTVQFKPARVVLLAKDHKRYFAGEIFDSIKSEVEGIIWPIFIFLALKNFISVGQISFVVGAGSIAFTLFVGRFHDRKSKYFLMKLGAVLYAAVWMLRLYTDSVFLLYATSLAAGFFAIMLSLSFNAIFYDKAAENKDVDEFVWFREIPTYIGRASLWIILILVADKFTWAFVMAGIASLFFLFFTFERRGK